LCKPDGFAFKRRRRLVVEMLTGGINALPTLLDIIAISGVVVAAAERATLSVRNP
jgi:hypothetical protein